MTKSYFPAIEVADVNDEQQLSALARKTFVLITTVGPYVDHGEPFFRACAEAGTHYLDCTGEYPWVGRMIQKYEKKAQASGAIMIPQNGVESAPADLCTWSIAAHIRREMGTKTGEVHLMFHHLRWVYLA